MEQKEAKVVLTIDYGTKKIGVCISETMTGHSKALPVVENNKNIFDDFDKIIADWLPNLCLIGVPSKASDEFLKSIKKFITCLLYTSPSPRDQRGSRMPSSA